MSNKTIVSMLVLLILLVGAFLLYTKYSEFGNPFLHNPLTREEAEAKAIRLAPEIVIQEYEKLSETPLWEQGKDEYRKNLDNLYAIRTYRDTDSWRIYVGYDIPGTIESGEVVTTQIVSAPIVKIIIPDEGEITYAAGFELIADPIFTEIAESII